MTTENDIAKRRHVLELTHQIADLMRDAGERYLELRTELGVSAADIIHLTLDHLPAGTREELSGGLLEPLPFFCDTAMVSLTTGKLSKEERNATLQAHARAHMEPGAFLSADSLPPGIHQQMHGLLDRASSDPGYRSTPMTRLIRKMFDEAPKVSATDAPALECQVVLRSGMPLVGALSSTPEGTLKMLVPTRGPTGEVLAECFFGYDDVLTVILTRDMVAAAPPSLIVRS